MMCRLFIFFIFHSLIVASLQADVLFRIRLNIVAGATVERPTRTNAEAYLAKSCGINFNQWKKTARYPERITAKLDMRPEKADIMFMYLCIRFMRASQWWTKNLAENESKTARHVNWCFRRGTILPSAGTFNDAYKDKSHHYRNKVLAEPVLMGEGSVSFGEERDVNDWSITVFQASDLGRARVGRKFRDIGAILSQDLYAGLVKDTFVNSSQKYLKLEHELGHVLQLADGDGGIMNEKGQVRTKFPDSFPRILVDKLDAYWGKNVLFTEGVAPGCACCRDPRSEEPPFVPYEELLEELRMQRLESLPERIRVIKEQLEKEEQKTRREALEKEKNAAEEQLKRLEAQQEEQREKDSRTGK